MLWNTVLFLTSVILFLGRKSEEEGVEDNGLEENSRDGQVGENMLAVCIINHSVSLKSQEVHI